MSTATATATATFGLTEIARVTVRGVHYVVYDDKQFRSAVVADRYDNVHPSYTGPSDYSDWCSSRGGAAEGDPEVAAEIAAAAEIPGITIAGGFWVDAAAVA